SNKQIYRVIYLGGKKVRKSHLMPPFGHTLSEAEIWSLVAYVRKLAGDESHPITLPESVDHQRPNLGSVSREKVKKFRRWLAENGEDTDILKKGEYLFKWRRSCFACHQVQEEGGRVGPNLSRAGDLYYPDWIYAWVSNPQQFRPQTRMPDMGIEEEEIRVIAAYMSHVLRDGKHFPEEWKVYFETP
ncbi:MAG: c-type cytochrome, partial [Nitrospinaceae bacterium]|nr:c-type cytochrome [Nitrospinaceae bacterium]NIR56362.1 c-type cytochrome [Nitrospinaceae bacterium]NIS86824.1 c-type cytochrome [Nitrospinaceae bacterium]NIT83660.1 c-type cytochrome [Nitrospinaceae bacterium]NIU45858.1 c-type cytochrome [Nitrospinaceae bacterium]